MSAARAVVGGVKNAAVILERTGCAFVGGISITLKAGNVTGLAVGVRGVGKNIVKSVNAVTGSRGRV